MLLHSQDILAALAHHIMHHMRVKALDKDLLADLDEGGHYYFYGSQGKSEVIFLLKCCGLLTGTSAEGLSSHLKVKQCVSLSHLPG